MQYAPGFYLSYLSRWPDLCCAQAAPSGRMMGYSASAGIFSPLWALTPNAVLGKAEGREQEWHGHITVLTVAPEYRRLHLASALVALLERVSDGTYHGYFVDLYVRCTNDVAIDMYERLGYSVYRRVREYYDHLGGNRGRDEEDAFDMRKPLTRDVGRRSVRANGRDMMVSRYEVS
ncbi:N-acetyltransferase [Mycena belliarum]|uniref:N-acetyltransferase n=1 Tax=Mycena belliarum TaxID=1033014 RepID=A0AAD6UB59_9AGAR|nr:N-acetyltransferase [Mycena belliae]